MVKNTTNKQYEAPSLTESRMVVAGSILAASADATFEGYAPNSASSDAPNVVTSYSVGDTNAWF